MAASLGRARRGDVALPGPPQPGRPGPCARRCRRWSVWWSAASRRARWAPSAGSSPTTTSSSLPTAPSPCARRRTGSPSSSTWSSCSSWPKWWPSSARPGRRPSAATEEARRLYELSQTLIGELTLSELLDHVVTTVQDAFSPQWTALAAARRRRARDWRAGVLEVAATAGEALDEAERASLTTDAGGGHDPVARPARRRHHGEGVPWPWWWVTTRWACWCCGTSSFGRPTARLLGAFANQAALAIDRARLREEALRARLLEEVDRWRSALMGAASHDLRTPLAVDQGRGVQLAPGRGPARTRGSSRPPRADRDADRPLGQVWSPICST